MRIRIHDGRGDSKVPAVTLTFWIIKIAATTLGETGGDTVTMTMDLGYLVGTLIFASLLVVLVAWQVAARRFHPSLYWATIIASTTAGTTLADFADRSLGIGYAGGWSAGQLKVAQEAIALVIFGGFMTLVLGEPLGWRHLGAFVCLMGAVAFLFAGRPA